MMDNHMLVGEILCIVWNDVLRHGQGRELFIIIVTTSIAHYWQPYGTMSASGIDVLMLFD